jgi:hypothetical protein
VKDGFGDALAVSHNILNWWKNYFSQLLNVHYVSDIRQIEIHTAGPVVPGSSRLEVEIPISKLKKYKSPGSGQIPTELIQTVGGTVLPEIHKLINPLWNRKNCLIVGKSILFYQFRKRTVKQPIGFIVIYVAAINFIRNIIEYPPLKFKSEHG